MKQLQRKTQSPKDFIVYEDNAILVCHKPSGLAVQTRQVAQKDLESILKTYVSSAASPYLAIINRLDQPVEGLILFAKTPEAAAFLTSQLDSHTLQKEYLALTSPAPAIAEQTLIDYLVRDGRQNLSFVIDPAHIAAGHKANAKKAELHYQTLQIRDTQALVKITLKTGRHHQIRVQMANNKTPLLGDTKYGGLPSPCLCLCSHRLAFLHPVTKTFMEFTVFPKNPAFSPFLSILQQSPFGTFLGDE